MMENIEGYTNSQTWEAWRDSINVLWENTEVVFLLSVTLSLGIVIYTWMQCPKSDDTKPNYEERRDFSEGSKSLNDTAETKEITTDSDGDHLSQQPSKLLPNTNELTQEIERRMSAEDKEKEEQVQIEQLAAIYRLMQDQKEKFGEISMDDIRNQMRFYCR